MVPSFLLQFVTCDSFERRIPHAEQRQNQPLQGSAHTKSRLLQHYSSHAEHADGAGLQSGGHAVCRHDTGCVYGGCGVLRAASLHACAGMRHAAGYRRHIRDLPSVGRRAHEARKAGFLLLLLGWHRNRTSLYVSVCTGRRPNHPRAIRFRSTSCRHRQAISLRRCISACRYTAP